MVKLKYTGLVTLLILNVAFEPGATVEVTPEAAWIIKEKYPKVMEVVSGTPVQPQVTPRRYIGRTATDEALRVADARPISMLPPEIPADIRGAIRKEGWKELIPAFCQKVDGALLALWCALSGLREQAEAVLRHVTVTE
jgi:hypothetical protein